MRAEKVHPDTSLTSSHALLPATQMWLHLHCEALTSEAMTQLTAGTHEEWGDQFFCSACRRKRTAGVLQRLVQYVVRELTCPTNHAPTHHATAAAAPSSSFSPSTGLTATASLPSP